MLTENQEKNCETEKKRTGVSVWLEASPATENTTLERSVPKFKSSSRGLRCRERLSVVLPLWTRGFFSLLASFTHVHHKLKFMPDVSGTPLAQVS